MMAGCGGPNEPAGPTFAVVDSAGIEIVTSHAPAWTNRQAWRVSNRPSLTIGELDGPLEFTFGNVRAVGQLFDGRYFVGDEQAHTIRVFSSDGDYLESVGREGDGPGELQWFLTVSPYRTDSLFVYDYAHRAVSVFSPELSFVRRFPNPVVQGNYWVSSALSDGRFLLYSPGASGRSQRRGLVPDSSWVILSAPDGSAVDTIGAFQVRTRYIGPGGRAEPLHLGPHAAIVAEGDRILIAEGDEFEFTEFGLDGSPRRITRKAHQPVPVTAEVKGDYKAWYMEWLGASPEGGSERIRRSLEEGHYSDQLPAVAADIKIDELGYVWVGRYHYPGQDTDEWDVFDSVGVWLGMVETPPGLQVHEIKADRIIGVGMDGFDVAYLRVHRLDRR